MTRKAVVVHIDDRTQEALRALAKSRGIVCRTGPGAREGRGNLSRLLMKLGDDYLNNRFAALWAEQEQEQGESGGRTNVGE